MRTNTPVLTKDERDVQLVGYFGIRTNTQEKHAGRASLAAEGLASLVKGEVPQEHEARPVDGRPENARTVKR